MRQAPFSPVGAVLDGGDPTQTGVIRQGRARVQDEGSQLAALASAEPGRSSGGALAGSLRRPRRKGRAARRGGRSRRRGPRRQRDGTGARRTGPQGAARCSVCAEVVAKGRHDASAVASRTGSTASCSTRRAPGSAHCAVGRRPAGASSPPMSRRWRELQVRLLESALVALKPGGILAYVTCSPHPGETRAVVTRRAATASGTGHEAGHPAKCWPASPGSRSRRRTRTHVQLWPHRARHGRHVHPAAAPLATRLAACPFAINPEHPRGRFREPARASSSGSRRPTSCTST